ncbi:hypothetical protein [Flavobacterium laiguense]|uniref:DUF5103 domain-containing protein n=1 Tax=Flavobacterium laiguense TaxID=2169409 RepID=A0A2U1K2D6_9FLAO|nr:hypothetical protein [Flavobacterium laiguense]PWA11680.1 hypothetical protein DB891_02425 [Flavobacterium laiguense]
MKKLIAFLILIQNSLLFSQTVLTSYPLELKKSKEYKQILNAENTNTHDLFVFASDKETVTILKYNSALFLSNQYTQARPDLDYKLLTGYSFNDEENPTLYWSSENLKKMMAVQYDLNTKTTAVYNYYLSFSNESIVTQFQENNTFYILSQKDLEQKLVLYVFKNGKKEEKTLDFSSFKFQNRNTKPLTLNQILEVCPIEKIETNQFNPLFKGTQKTKLYVLKNRLLLTLDHNFNETQVFDIDLSTFEIQEKKFLQPATKKQIGLANSFYHENKIYQLNSNDDELLLEIKDYRSKEIIKNHQVSKTDTITFKNSPLYIQIDNQKPREVKNTAKFLQRLLYMNTGLTVYKTPKTILVTLGGTSDPQSNYADLSRRINAAVDANSTDVAYDLLNNAGPTTVYFESIFDKKLQQTKQEQEPLAIDFISRFTNEHTEVSLGSTIRFKNYYIFGYYDMYAKQYIMRKFTDGFDPSF